MVCGLNDNNMKTGDNGWECSYYPKMESTIEWVTVNNQLSG